MGQTEQNIFYIEYNIYLDEPHYKQETKLNTRIEPIVVFSDTCPKCLLNIADNIKDVVRSNCTQIHEIAHEFLLGIPYYKDGDYVVKESDDPIMVTTAYFMYSEQSGVKVHSSVECAINVDEEFHADMRQVTSADTAPVCEIVDAQMKDNFA